MSKVKTGLMYSPLSEKIYWGRMNTETGVSSGSNKKDVTSDFISIMLQKFKINTMQRIENNGEHECSIFVLDPKKAAMREAAPDMYEMLNSLREEYGSDSAVGKDIDALLEKARGEHG